MSQIIIAYWSGTGNTEIMAKHVGKGVEDAGKEARVVSVDEITPEDLSDCPVFALGCPSMGAEELEETVMEPFVKELEEFVTDKTIGLFGSYGWGDGEWMSEWVERMKTAGAEVIGDVGVICNEEPDDEAKESCRKLGESLAEL